MSDDELNDFERRRKLIEGIVFAPDEFIEKVYSDYGKSLLSSAGGALGAAAGVAVGGPVGGIVGGVVGKKTAGKLVTENGPFISTAVSYTHLRAHET